jgi:hypothetical protein
MYENEKAERSIKDGMSAGFIQMCVGGPGYLLGSAEYIYIGTNYINNSFDSSFSVMDDNLVETNDLNREDYENAKGIATTAVLLFSLGIELGTLRAQNAINKANINSKGGAGPNLSRSITKASELDPGMFADLENNGTISSGGRSGGLRPPKGAPNSFITTDAGHTLVYDGGGDLIYDISPKRVKMRVWDIAPDGSTFPRDIKLEGPVPSDLLNKGG